MFTVVLPKTAECLVYAGHLMNKISVEERGEDQ